MILTIYLGEGGREREEKKEKKKERKSDGQTFAGLKKKFNLKIRL